MRYTKILPVITVIALLTLLGCSRTFKFDETNSREIKIGKISVRIPANWQWSEDNPKAKANLGKFDLEYFSNDLTKNYFYVDQNNDLQRKFEPEYQLFMVFPNIGKMGSSIEEVRKNLQADFFDKHIGDYVTTTLELLGDKLYYVQDVKGWDYVQYEFWEAETTKQSITFKIWTKDKKMTPEIEYILSTVKIIR